MRHVPINVRRFSRMVQHYVKVCIIPHHTRLIHIASIIYLNLTRLRRQDSDKSLGRAVPTRPLTLVCVVQSIPICNTRYFTFCIANKHLQTVAFQLPSLPSLSCLRFSRDAKPFLILPFLFPYISPSTPWFSEM